MKLFTMSIVLAFLAFSCKKERPIHTSVSGHVYSTGSGKPIEGAHIFMYDGLPDSNGGSSKRDSTITDSNGYFHLELDGEEPVIFPYKKGYMFEYEVGGAVIGIMPINPGTNENNLKINLDGIAHFSPVLMNKVMQTNEDSVSLYITHFKYNVDNDILNSRGNGPHETSFLGLEDGYTILGDHYQKYKVKYERNNQWNVFSDSVYVKLGEVYRDTIWY